MKKYFLLLGLVFFLSYPVLALSQSQTIEYFYGEGCAHCAKVEPYIKQLEEKYNLVILKKEIYRHQENAIILNNYFDVFAVPKEKRGIPALFINQKVFIGDDSIINNLDYEFAHIFEKHEQPQPIKEEKQKYQKTFWQYFWAVIIGPAFVDSINPCAIAVLIILLGALTMYKDRKRALLGALAFTLSIYITYFIFGLGLTHFIQISGVSEWIYEGVGILAILLGLANLKDYIWYGGGGFVMEIPRRWRSALKTILSKITSPLGAFLIGFVVTLFELPCTGGPYFFVIGLMAEKNSMAMIVPLLLLYNIVFVIPLLLITCSIYWGISTVEKTTTWKERNIRLLHLIGGIVMTFLGILVLFF